jgi:hypothetical protein
VLTELDCVYLTYRAVTANTCEVCSCLTFYVSLSVATFTLAYGVNKAYYTRYTSPAPIPVRRRCTPSRSRTTPYYPYIRVCGVVSSPITGLAQCIPITRFCAKEHRARVDGRATARHLHGMIERAVRCHTVKLSAESAGAVASTMFFQSLTTRQSGRLAQPDGGAGTPAGRGCHLQGRSAPLVDHSMKVGASHTPSLTPLPLTSPSLQRW